MSAAFQMLCSLLEPHGLRMHGDRGRAACPVCGGKNRSTLSVGQTPEGAVLLKCFKSGCSVESIVAAIGLEVTDLFPPREHSAPPMARRRLLTAGQALDLLDAEAGVVAIVASDIAHGRDISKGDRDRVLVAAARIAALRQEVRS